MLLELILAILAGILVGCFTGITPGVHINTVTAILISNISLFYFLSIESLVAFIASLAVSHTILDFIPSILTGATDDESFMSVLPGHQMLKEGKGREAIFLVLIGALTSIPIILIITPIFIKLVPIAYERIIFFIPFLLIFISIYTIIRDDKAWSALVVFLATGLLGYASLNSAVKDPLLPLLGGLFGASSIIISLKQKVELPLQEPLKFPKFKEIKKDYFQALVGSVISSPLCSFLPAIGSGHAATISSEITNQSRKSFLIMLGTINLVVMVLSFATLYSLGKTRTGASAAVKELLGELSIQNLWKIITITIITIIITAFVALMVTNLFIKLMEKLNYRKISLSMLLILTIAVLTLSNIAGFLVFITSTAWGIFAIQSNIKRINMMGCLLIPTIIIYLTNAF
jgi:putative membrane protein